MSSGKQEVTDTGTILVDGGFLIWTYGPSVQTRQGWQQVLWDYTKDTGHVIVLDGGSSHRRAYYAEYKSRRREKWSEEEDPEKLARRESVFEFARKIIEPDPRLAVVKYEHFEADDIIAAWCVHHSGWLKVVGTDKDLVQLGKRNIRLRKHSGTVITVDKFRSSLPKSIQPYVSASKINLVLACLGDKSDSIPRLIPSGLPSLKQFAQILQDEDPWGRAMEAYGAEDVIRNLYLSILPGPWVFEEVPTPEEVMETIRFAPSAYYERQLRADILEGYDRHVTIKKPIKDLLEELGYGW